MVKRIEWIDQAKGLGIFLVVYGHNFPITEKYIYSFHMPLFFLLAGFFHPTMQSFNSIQKRAKQTLIPYFIWAFFLYLFWFAIGRNVGESANFNLSSIKNFIGIIFAQGGIEYMDWGIPLWFIPAIFLSFLLFYFIRLIPTFNFQLIVILISVLLGFLISRFFNRWFIWSLDVAFVSLFFYAVGFYSKSAIIKLKKQKAIFLMFIVGMLHLILFSYNGKVDMYRSNYGNEFFFILNGLLGSLFVIFLFKITPNFKVLSVLGKFTIPILALHLAALAFIKLSLMVLFDFNEFNFSEPVKFIISILQVLLILPLAFFINKFLPVLNGGSKKI